MRRTSAIGRVAILSLLGALVVSPGPAAPVPDGAGKLPPPTAAQLRQSQNNLKQLLIACHGYHDTYGNFPNNVYTKDGKGLLSWRVLILPFLDEGQQFQLFKQDEPWDSETNKKLVEKMPKLYAPVRVRAKAGETFYRGFVGEMAPFGPSHGKGRSLAAFVDGSSNTGLVFEAADGAVHRCRKDADEKELKRLINPADGEEIDFAKLDAK